jgi:hypothetical protein
MAARVPIRPITIISAISENPAWRGHGGAKSRLLTTAIITVFHFVGLPEAQNEAGAQRLLQRHAGYLRIYRQNHQNLKNFSIIHIKVKLVAR